jgi:hypothetical protein
MGEPGFFVVSLPTSRRFDEKWGTPFCGSFRTCEN